MSDSPHDLDQRYGRRNPRTDAEPMAFTFGEFARGAFTAWGWFLAASVPGLFLTGLVPAVVEAVAHPERVPPSSFGWGFAYLLYGYVPVVLPVSFVALVVFSPFAYLLGCALRRQPRRGVHLVAFTGLGLVIGLAVAGVFWIVTGAVPLLLTAFVIIVTATVPYGWYRAATRALEPISAARLGVPR